MKKKNGFISSSVVYSFFFVFLMMLIFILVSYSNNRNLLKTMKKDVKNDISDTNFARYLVNHYDEDGIKLVNHNGTNPNGVNDNSYRFSGTNPNNYVCFGSNATTCPSDNLYRIIGVINGKIKIVKNSSVGNIAWDTTDTNVWINTSLITYLNNTFYNTFSEEYKKLIETNTWYVGGLDVNIGIQNAKTVHNYEVGDNKNTGVYVSNKIGLLYLSDYALATTDGYWTIHLSSYNNANLKNNNWLDDLNMNTWFLSRVSTYVNQTYYMSSTGEVKYTTVNNTYGVRPVFFLNSITKKTGGIGSSSNPYRIG